MAFKCDIIHQTYSTALPLYLLNMICNLNCFFVCAHRGVWEREVLIGLISIYWRFLKLMTNWSSNKCLGVTWIIIYHPNFGSHSSLKQRLSSYQVSLLIFKLLFYQVVVFSVFSNLTKFHDIICAVKNLIMWMRLNHMTE